MRYRWSIGHWQSCKRFFAAVSTHAGAEKEWSVVLHAKLLNQATLKVYPGYPHGMITTRADVINADILAFLKDAAVKAA